MPFSQSYTIQNNSGINEKGLKLPKSLSGYYSKTQNGYKKRGSH